MRKQIDYKNVSKSICLMSFIKANMGISVAYGLITFKVLEYREVVNGLIKDRKS